MLEKSKRGVKMAKESLRMFHLHLGEETKRAFKYIKFYGKEIFSEIISDTYFIHVYTGEKGIYLVYFLIREGCAEFQTMNTLEEVAAFIAYQIPTIRGVSKGDKQSSIRRQYIEVATKFLAGISEGENGGSITL